MIYPDRQTAGRLLAQRLTEYANRENAHREKTIVLALPRGGVPVAKEVAQALNARLDVLVVRKLGLPWQPELAAGAIAPHGVVVMNSEVQAAFRNLDAVLAPLIKRERAELERREKLYRKNQPPLELGEHVAILVDDGIATGATMEAAVLALRAMRVHSVVIAVPVAPPETVTRLAGLADRVICLQQPRRFMAVGEWYEDFPQLSDDQVTELLTARSSTSV